MQTRRHIILVDGTIICLSQSKQHILPAHSRRVIIIYWMGSHVEFEHMISQVLAKQSTALARANTSGIDGSALLYLKQTEKPPIQVSDPEWVEWWRNEAKNRQISESTAIHLKAVGKGRASASQRGHLFRASLGVRERLRGEDGHCHAPDLVPASPLNAICICGTLALSYCSVIPKLLSLDSGNSN